MPSGEICDRAVIVVQHVDTVLEAAKLMRQHRVRDVQVVEDRDGERVPIGIITDHDLVVEIMAPELDYLVITVGDDIDLHAH